MTPQRVSVTSSAARARPKSVSTARSTPFSKRMLAGFTSRCTRPCSWAAASPAAACMPMRRISLSSKRPWAVSRWASDSPATSGMTRNGNRPLGCTWWIASTLGCTTAAAAWASRANRFLASELWARCGDKHLDRHAPLQLAIEPLEHDPHAAAADDLQHVVAAQAARARWARRRAPDARP